MKDQYIVLVPYGFQNHVSEKEVTENGLKEKQGKKRGIWRRERAESEEAQAQNEVLISTGSKRNKKKC